MPKRNFKNDSEALLEMAGGNLDAYRYLFDQHFPDLCNFLLIYLHSRELSEEIALEIFTYIWEKREVLRIRATFKSFLFASAKNKAISLYRKEQKIQFTSLDAGVSSIPEDSRPEDVMEVDELRTLIEEAVNKLPEKSQKIYRMAWEKNLSYKEIAGQMGISPKTVENQVGIALRKLRESLSPYYKQIFMIWLMTFFLD